MRGKDLLLLARRFPFNRGEVAAESYLETEVLSLARHFDRIVAVGTEADSGSVPTCMLPDNVEPLALGCGASSREKLGYLLSGVVGKAVRSKPMGELSQADKAGGLARRLFRDYFAGRALAKYRKLTSWLATSRFSPTHFYSFWLYDTAITELWLRREHPEAVAFARAHGYDLYNNRNVLNYLPFRESLLSGLDLVFACSNDGREYLNSQWPGHEEKVHVSYLGTKDLPDKSHERRQDVFRVVSCSRVVDIKRVGLLAEALGQLDVSDVRIAWTHYGDGPMLSEVKKVAERYRFVEAMFPGKVDNAELLKLYSSHHFDLFVNVSESEGLPISIMEACGVGLPVVATDVGGTKEVVIDGENGLLLDPDASPLRVADTIMEVMQMGDGDYLHMRESARRIWRERFRTGKNVELMLESVESLGGVY